MLSNLPAVVREQLNPRHRVKVRISQDQKTGQVLAQIIKCRIKDLDIYMPNRPLDCRISINFEMKFDMDVEDIIAASTGDRQPDRNKDRLSYTQSHYQIDLTQVTQTTNTNVSPTSRDISSSLLTADRLDLRRSRNTNSKLKSLLQPFEIKAKGRQQTHLTNI